MLFKNRLIKQISGVLAFLFTFTFTFADIPIVLSSRSAHAAIAPLPPVSGISTGYISGNFSVNQQGGSNYSIPIVVPPGTGGMVPQLSLNYDSQGSSSMVGKGWSLSGLSSITRCPTSKALDNLVDPVDFDANDKFCLEGQRLIAINGAYGADGADYRTENDIFAQIFSYGTSGSGPAHFVVKTKNGLTYNYGNTTDSRVEAQGKAEVLFWALNRIEDSVGNYLTVSYSENNALSESYPTRIDYTGNASMSVLPYNSVRFIYENRPDTAAHFVGGSQVQLNQRLKKIETYLGTTLLNTYELTYAQSVSTGQSRLISLKECAADGTCLLPTTFNWQDKSNGQFSETSVPRNGQWSNREVYPGDYNADGITDLLSIGDTNNFVVYYFKGDGSYTTSSFPRTGQWSSSAVFPGDYNGDGITDLLTHVNNNFVTYFFKPNGTVAATSTPRNGQWSVPSVNQIA